MGTNGHKCRKRSKSPLNLRPPDRFYGKLPDFPRFGHWAQARICAKPPDMGTNRPLFQVRRPTVICHVSPVLEPKICGRHDRHSRDRTQEVASSSLASSTILTKVEAARSHRGPGLLTRFAELHQGARPFTNLAG